MAIIFIGFYFFISCVNSAPTWVSIADLPQALWETGGVEVNGLIYSVGGSDTYNYDWSAVFAYNISTNIWTRVTNLTLPRRYHGTTVLNGLIYVCGGYYGQTVLNSAEYYDPVKNTWTVISSMNISRQGLTANTGSDNQIYAIGGMGTTVEVYNPLTTQWKLGPSLLVDRQGHASVSSLDGTEIFVFGGYSQNGYQATCEMLSISSQKWAMIAPMNSNRFALGAAVDMSGLYYALSGYINGSVCDGSVEVYNSSTNQWNSTRIPKMLNSRTAFGTARGKNDKIYVFGGECSYPVLNKSECLTFNNTDSSGSIKTMIPSVWIGLFGFIVSIAISQ